MKARLLLLMLIVMTPIVLGKTTITLKEMEEENVNGINIALVKFDKDEEKAIICVNGEKTIVTKKEKTIGFVVVEAERFYEDSVRFKVDVNCKYCITVSNEGCLPRIIEKEEAEEEIKEYRCEFDMECDDNDECTEEECVEGMCVYKPKKECFETEEIIEDEDDNVFVITNFLVVLVIVVVLALMLRTRYR